MEILITNDDGWGVQGLMTLVRHMTKLGHVTIVAPDGPRSSMSNSISLTKPMTMEKVDLKDCNDFSEEEKKHIDAYISSGTPSDCVKLALNVLFHDDASRVDLLVSGINHGSNASINVVYSGTMGACFTGCEHGIKAIGFSIYTHEQPTDMSNFEPYIIELTRHLLSEPWQPLMCYNINAPLGKLNGVKWTRQCHGHWEKEIDVRQDENGKPIYWMTGNFINEEPDATDTDEWAVANGYISVQPCTADMTNYGAL
ncbi:MAG: 5'/3'-nucleotidase SurE [Paludibacteraceae bacterium]|nr:5'/3'-nucleotidase SurE [Paludibacteraceae bacterium]